MGRLSRIESAIAALQAIPNFAPIVGSTFRFERLFMPMTPLFNWFNVGQPDTTILSSVAPNLADAYRNFKATVDHWGENKNAFDVAGRTVSAGSAILHLKKNANLSGTVQSATLYNVVMTAVQTLSKGMVLIFGSDEIAHVTADVTANANIPVDCLIRTVGTTARVATSEELLARAISAEKLVKRTIGNDWFVLSTSVAIGNIPAGEYYITDSNGVDQITIAGTFTAESYTAGVFNGAVTVYPNRIIGSNDARHFSTGGHLFSPVGNGDKSIVAGFRRMDYSYRITGALLDTPMRYLGGLSSNDAFSITSSSGNGENGSYSGTNVYFDSNGSPGARTKYKETNPKETGVHVYVYAGTVNA